MHQQISNTILIAVNYLCEIKHETKIKKPHTVRIGSKSYRCKIDTTHPHTYIFSDVYNI